TRSLSSPTCGPCMARTAFKYRNSSIMQPNRRPTRMRTVFFLSVHVYPEFNSENVSRRGSGQVLGHDARKCKKSQLHSVSGVISGIRVLEPFYLPRIITSPCAITWSLISNRYLNDPGPRPARGVPLIKRTPGGA